MESLSMEYVDSHFHIWQLDKFEYPWPTPDTAVLYKSFTVEQLEEQMKQTPLVKHAVFVQVLNNKPEEIEWLTELAKEHKVIKGIVGSLDLTDPKFSENIRDIKKKNPLLKGCRHILDLEKEDWITKDEVFQGLKVLESEGLTFDLLLRPHLLKYIPGVVERLPNLKFVVDHIAKPYAKNGKEEERCQWEKGIAAIAKFKNVYVKLSGLVNELEGDLENWKKEDFQPYVDYVVDCFGKDRCMFGSDWPVCSLAGCSYADVFELLNKLLPSLSEDDKIKLFRENAKTFYSLDL